MSTAVGARDLRDALEGMEEPGAAELVDALKTILREDDPALWAYELVPLKHRVYRLRLGASRTFDSLILKRSEPSIAEVNRLVAERWLPALDLGGHCAPLLATTADRQGRWFWQIYEDLGEHTLERDSEPAHVAGTIDLIATLHLRGMGHALLPEVRHHTKDLGLAFFISNVNDSIRGLEEVGRDRTGSRELHALADGLLARLRPLVVDLSGRAEVFKKAAGPDTILHGDLWRANAFARVSGEHVDVRLIDWDHVGVGPLTYDLSTFLLRFPPADRSWILRRYRDRLSVAGRALPSERDLNTLFETAEYARFANRLSWAAMAWLHEGAGWVPIELAEIERWFEDWRPTLTE